MSIKNFFSYFKNRRTYTYVPQCPFCKSYNTVYFIHTNFSTKASPFQIAKHLKNGEYVRFRGMFESEEAPTCFCENCGIEWSGRPQQIFVSEERIQEERKLREITDDLIAVYDNCKENFKKEKKRRRKEKRKAKRESGKK